MTPGDIIPFKLSPLLKTRPWGGDRLASLFGKALPPGEAIGESWELADLPQDVSCVAAGRLAGTPLSGLREAWGRGLTGDAALVDGRLPLLVKFLDARQNLSVQVHPRPAADGAVVRSSGVKHEAWYVVDAAPDAVAYIGLRPGVRVGDVARAGATAELVDLLHCRPARAGDCFYLPSGTPHALGGGLVVAEVQTPSDVTYRLYDWDRVGLDGRPRALHFAEALTNLRDDVREDEIVQPRRSAASAFGPARRLASSHAFTIDLLDLRPGDLRSAAAGALTVLILAGGRCALSWPGGRELLQGGDVAVLPAASARTELAAESQSQVLVVGGLPTPDSGEP